jgi:hypothetical protein
MLKRIIAKARVRLTSSVLVVILIPFLRSRLKVFNYSRFAVLSFLSENAGFRERFVLVNVPNSTDDYRVRRVPRRVLKLRMSRFSTAGDRG